MISTNSRINYQLLNYVKLVKIGWAGTQQHSNEKLNSRYFLSNVQMQIPLVLVLLVLHRQIFHKIKSSNNSVNKNKEKKIHQWEITIMNSQQNKKTLVLNMAHIRMK